MDFYIESAYLTDIVVRTEYPHYPNRTELNAEELIAVIKNPVPAVSIHTKDHPEFNCLRELLEQQGYIKVERGWWNGDRVLEPFALNNIQFKRGAQFPCAAAMGIHLQVRRKYQQRKGRHHALD